MLAILTAAGGIAGIFRMAAAGLVAGTVCYLVGHWNGASDERASNNAKIAVEAVKVEKERVSDDAALSKLSDHDLCVRDLRARRLPIDICSDL
jgi:hypothetical protein